MPFSKVPFKINNTQHTQTVVNSKIKVTITNLYLVFWVENKTIDGGLNEIILDGFELQSLKPVTLDISYTPVYNKLHYKPRLNFVKNCSYFRVIH